MRDRRIELQGKLEEILGSENVYFQPPENVKLKYPCFVYERSSIETRPADNFAYHGRVRYRLTVISYDPDLPWYDSLIGSFQYISYSNHMGKDSLNNDTYDLYY